MTTKKLKYFEYAGQTSGPSSGGGTMHLFDAFDSPNGFVFVVVGNNLGSATPEKSLNQITIDRIRYYLDNEVTADPTDAPRNALIYANGFIHVMSDKNPGIKLSELSCLCVLIRDNKVYYAWVGQVCLFLFEGRKLLPLTYEVYRQSSSETKKEPWQISFLGQDKIVKPGVCTQALVPVNGDMLLMGSGLFCLDAEERPIRKVLSDSMPTHSKVTRIIGNPEEEVGLSCLLVQFYNLDQRSRLVSAALPDNKISKTVEEGPRPTKKAHIGLLKTLLHIAGAIIIAYMAYDMFLFNPRRGIDRLSSYYSTEYYGDETITTKKSDDDKLPGESIALDQEQTNNLQGTSIQNLQGRELPADIQYTVRRGDTWGRIYREFEVCSWFIRNHPQNRGKFDPANNPIAGNTIVIPIMYSASARLNPVYYREFTTDKVGTACQNANQGFIDRFKETLRQ